MSATYSFVCDDCRVSMWVGQGNSFYDYPGIFEFLTKHLDHKIRFRNDLVDDETIYDYKEIRMNHEGELI